MQALPRVLLVVPIEEEGDAVTGQPRQVSISAIRELLSVAFSAETLPRFCQDRPAFQPVLRKFGPHHGLDDMVAEVIDYCQTRLLWDELLREVQRANPRQYARFEDRLYSAPVAESVPSAPPARGRAKRPWEPPRPAWFWPAVGGAAAVLVVILALIVWLPGPGPNPEPTAAPATKAPNPPVSPEPTDELVSVPELRDELCDWLDSDLERANLRLDGEPSWEVNSEVPYDHVLRTDPPAGTQVRRDSAVKAVCSLGGPWLVPHVEGSIVQDAEWSLYACCNPPFETKVVPEITTNPSEVGRVIRTVPPGGATADPGSVVILYVGDRPSPVKVPEVAGLLVDDATEQLEALLLRVGEVITETSETVDEGRVIRTEPASGDDADTGTEVDLVVSSGPEAVIVPNLVEQTLEAAVQELEGLGLKAVQGGEQYDDDVPQGSVISTDPHAGKSVVPGYEVKLVVSSGLDPEGDRDGDGMPNGWEADHRLDPRVNDASSDPDKDKLTNLAEWENQTNPWNAEFPSIRVGLYYRGERLPSVTSAVPSIEVRPSEQVFPTVYDVELGEFTVFNVPAGEYMIGVEIDVDGNGYPRAGDLKSPERKSFTVLSDRETVRGDIDLISIIHLTEPVDNAFAIPRHDLNTFDLYGRDGLLFRWDSFPGAASYLIIVGEYQYEPTRTFIGEIVNLRTEQTSYWADLPPSSDGHYYWLTLFAYTSNSTLLGGLYLEYSFSSGVVSPGYQFRLQ